MGKKEVNKTIAGVTINYEDGTSEKLEHFALAGSTENTWFKVMYSPAKNADKVKLNNMIAELSASLIAAIGQDE